MSRTLKMSLAILFLVGLFSCILIVKSAMSSTSAEGTLWYTPYGYSGTDSCTKMRVVWSDLPDTYTLIPGSGFGYVYLACPSSPTNRLVEIEYIDRELLFNWARWYNVTPVGWGNAGCTIVDGWVSFYDSNHIADTKYLDNIPVKFECGRTKMPIIIKGSWRVSSPQYTPYP
jgi:hypothetical protein